MAQAFRQDRSLAHIPLAQVQNLVDPQVVLKKLNVSSLGPIKKKKLIQERFRTILSVVSALCENMNESISSLFGHTLTHGFESEKK